jgi:hypothetical protein
MLRLARELPRNKRNSRKSAYEDDLREFMRARMDVAIIEREGKDAHSITQGVQHHLRKHRDRYPGVHVAERKDSAGVSHAYVYRVWSEVEGDR